MELLIEERTLGSTRILVLTGRLTGVTAAELELWLKADALPPTLWDVSGLEFVSSAGLRVLMLHEKRARQAGRRTVLAGLQPPVREVLRITGAAAMWEQVDSVAEAVGSRPDGRGEDSAGAGGEERTAPGGERFRWFRSSSAGDGIIRWEGAGLRGASLQELAVSFGRGGIGVRKEEAAARPLRFLTLGHTLAYHRDDGESDALPVADPGTSFIRVEEGWSLTGEAAGVMRVVDATDPATLGAALREAIGEERAAWIGAVLCTPEHDGNPGRIAVGILPATLAPAWIGVSAPLLSPPTGELSTLEALLDATFGEVADGPAEGLPERIPAGSVAFGWGCPSPRSGAMQGVRIGVPPGGPGQGDETELIVRSLYSDCREVRLTPLSGGFSATTWQVASFDAVGRRLLPTVLKVGPASMMNRENGAHERHVRPFILNNATVGLGAAAQGELVGLRYNFLGVTGEGADLRTLAQRWERESAPRVRALYDTLARETLRPWYGQAYVRDTALYRDHTPLRLFPGLPQVARDTLPFDIGERMLPCPPLGRELPNPWWFLEHEFPRRADRFAPCRVSITHGDLNLNNVLSDERDNLYVIDFSETQERSVASDFARLEPVFLLEQAGGEAGDNLDGFLRDLEMLYADRTPLSATPDHLGTVDPERLAFVGGLRRLAHHYMGEGASEEAYLLPLFEWTLPIVLFGNRPLWQRHASTWMAALQLERLLRREAQG